MGGKLPPVEAKTHGAVQMLCYHISTYERSQLAPPDGPQIIGVHPQLTQLRVLRGKEESLRSPVSRTDAYAEKTITRIFSPSAYSHILHLEINSCFTSLSGEEVSFDDLRSI